MSAILKTNLTTISAYNEAQTTIAHWGVGGDYSRALNVVTNIIVGSTAGQGTTQLSGNAIAPYAAELIGNTFDHTDNPNEVAQLLSHAVLGGVLAYVNGGNATSGAIAGAGAEAASLAITQELYPEAFDENGVFHRDQLTETQANAIVALSSAVGAFVGGVSGGGINDAVIDANVAGNAVENNRLKDYTDKPFINATNLSGAGKDVPTMPDYINLTAGVGLVNGNVAVNLYNGEIFYGGGASLPSDGKIDWGKFGISISGGYIVTNPNQFNMTSDKFTSEFLGGLSGQTGACGFGGCIGINASAEGKLKGVISTEIGIGTPGISFGGSESQSLGNIE